MRADQKIVVGGTFNGKREVSKPLPANEALYLFGVLKNKGYSLLTMTDAETGHDYDVGKFMSAGTPKRQ